MTSLTGVRHWWNQPPIKTILLFLELTNSKLDMSRAKKPAQGLVIPGLDTKEINAKPENNEIKEPVLFPVSESSVLIVLASGNPCWESNHRD
jgi:hypothetical protein